MDVNRLKHWSNQTKPLHVSTTTHPPNYQPMESQQAHMGKGLEHDWQSACSMDDGQPLALDFPIPDRSRPMEELYDSRSIGELSAILPDIERFYDGRWVSHDICAALVCCRCSDRREGSGFLQLSDTGETCWGGGFILVELQYWFKPGLSTV